MSGTLRDDLCEWMYEWEKKADLTLAIGTSLCGMNADRMVEGVAKRASKGQAQGAVIISLQQTQYDDVSSLRIFAKIDDVMLMLAQEMGLSICEDFLYRPKVPLNCFTSRKSKGSKFRVPYSRNGTLLSGIDPAECEDASKVSFL